MNNEEQVAHEDMTGEYRSGGMTKPLLLKASEVAVMLGMGRSKVYELIATNELPVVRIGGAIRVPRRALLEWIERRTTSKN